MRRIGIATVLTVILAGSAQAQLPGGINNPYMQNPYNPYSTGYNPYAVGGYGYGGPMFGPLTNPYQSAASIYNRASQPLSPYLNLLRGGNPAVNYFYGVRPGLAVGQPIGQNWGNPMVPGMSQLRTGFVPAAASQSQEPTEMPREGAEIPALPPSGHPVTFGGGRGYGSAAPSRPGIFGSQPPRQSGGKK